jgi:branched-chain amino acid transport system ATP-binding protein
MTTGVETVPILTGARLSKRYGGVVALDDVSLSVRPGEILGVVGPNGAGKTTLVDLITGAQSADAGELHLEGRRLAGSAARRARLGLARTFQHPLLDPEVDVLEAIVCGVVAGRMGNPWRQVVEMVRGAVHSVRADYPVAATLAAELGVHDVGRSCGQLSLGEQRLVEVVRALAQDPVVMLLDEPFAGADHAGVTGTVEAIRTVQVRGHGVVLVDHNVDLIAGLADRILLLDRGRVVFDGDPEECLASDEMKAVYFGGGSGA